MFTILGFYKFKNLKSLNKVKLVLHKLFLEKNIRGTLIISREGLNGTISGKSKDISFINEKIKSLFNLILISIKNELLPLTMGTLPVTWAWID